MTTPAMTVLDHTVVFTPATPSSPPSSYDPTEYVIPFMSIWRDLTNSAHTRVSVCIDPTPSALGWNRLSDKFGEYLGNVIAGDGGVNITTGAYNTLIGKSAGNTITTESSNTLFGAETDVQAGVSGALCIGRQAKATASGQLVLGSANYPLSTQNTSGALSKYLEATVNGTTYRIPLNAVS